MPHKLLALALLLSLELACDYDRTPPIPPGTPDCITICEMAWPCGAVLQNDLDTCMATCDDNEHQAYRGCVYRNADACDLMANCKVYAPAP